MERKELIREILDEVTFSGAIPVSPPEREIERQIELAKEYFYSFYYRALQRGGFTLPRSILENSEYQRTRKVYIEEPKCVRYVVAIVPQGYGITDFWKPEFSLDKFLLPAFKGRIRIGEQLVHVVQWFHFIDVTRTLVRRTIRFSWNYNEKSLYIMGYMIDDMFVECYTEIPEEKLFDDWLFRRYVANKVKIRYADMLNFMSVKLPGNITLNTGALKEEATRELEMIENKIKDRSRPLFIITSHF